MSEAQTATIGDNQPTAFAALQDRVAELIKKSQDLAGRDVENKEDAEAIDALLTEIKSEEKIVDEARRDEKTPFDKGAAEVQGRYKPLLTTLSIPAKALKGRLGVWLAKERARVAEEQRVADEAALKLLQDEEDAKAKAEAGGENDIVSQVEAEIAGEEAADAMKTSKDIGAQSIGVKGGESKKARNTRKVWSAEITNYDEALAYYAGNAEIMGLVQTLADRAARSPDLRDAKIPGVKISFTEEVV